MEKEKVLQIQKEYNQNLFHNNRKEKPIIHKFMEGSVILKGELKLVLAKMNMNKVAGPNESVIEMQTTLGEFGTLIILLK